MKAKLIKKEYGYVLGVEDKLGTRLIAVSSQKQQEILDRLDVVCEYKLSLKNCQAIERGYDLDELAKQYGIDTTGSPYVFTERMDGFKAGFQKTVEILGDKKFTGEDVDKAVEWGIKNGRAGDVTHYDIDNFIQSLKQTEWDVEVQVDNILSFEANQSNAKVNPNFGKPKLDADGCLILKRI